MAPGLFLVLEGGEGVGKTTQWTRLAETLSQRGHDVRALREPGGTAVGDELRRILLDSTSRLTAETEAFLFSASRAQLVAELIVPALDEGAIVLVDRFLLSTFAYQGAGRGLSLEALRAMSRVATRGLVPDLTLLLSLPLDEAFARAQARGVTDRMERESTDFHKRVEAAFEQALKMEWQAAHPEIGRVERVDASGSADDVLQRCLSALAARWPDRFRDDGRALNSRDTLSTASNA